MRHWLLLMGALLAACAAPGPSVHENRVTSEEVSSFEESCEDERSVVPLCREVEGEEEQVECGFFRCQEVVPREVLLAFRGGGPPIYIPMGSPSTRRWWGRNVLWPRNTEPVLTFRFNRHLDPKPPAPPPRLLPPGRFVRHHIFPQAEDLALWFRERGVKIHDFTLVIPEHIHRRIHGGGPSGGLWNEAWRRFRDDNRNASPEAIYLHAGELIFRFGLAGPIVPYR